MTGRSIAVPAFPASRPAHENRYRIKINWEDLIDLPLALAAVVNYRSAGPPVTLEWLGEHDPLHLDELLNTVDEGDERLFFALVVACEHYQAAIAAADRVRVEVEAAKRMRQGRYHRRDLAAV